MSTREFAVVPPDLRMALAPLAFGLALGLGAIALAAGEDPRVWLAALPLALVCALVALMLRRRRVRLEDGMLVVEGGLHRARVPVAGLDLAHARVLDLAEHTTLRPLFKRFGMALPGYKAGHFRLRDGSKAFVLLTDTRRVLVLPETSGRRLLLSLQQPQALLDTLCAAAPPC